MCLYFLFFCGAIRQRRERHMFLWSCVCVRVTVCLSLCVCMLYAYACLRAPLCSMPWCVHQCLQLQFLFCWSFLFGAILNLFDGPVRSARTFIQYSLYAIFMRNVAMSPVRHFEFSRLRFGTEYMFNTYNTYWYIYVCLYRNTCMV